MLLQSRLLLAATMVAVVSAARAQTVYDDFSGNRIDDKRWTADGDQQHVAVAGSFVRFSLPGDREANLVSIDAFRGDVDLVVDFASFAATGVSPSNLVLSVFDADGAPDKISFVEIEISGSSAGRAFAVAAERNGVGHGTALVATKATAGWLRLRRSGGTTAAMVREAGKSTWTTLRSWSDFLTDLVYIELSAETPSGATLAVICDKVTYGGTRVTSPVSFGTGCNGLRARPWSIPYLGNATYGAFAFGDGRLANAPALMIFGTGKLDLDLSAAGAPGCRLYATPDLVLPIRPFDRDAETFVLIPMPNDANLVGARFYEQFAAISNQNALKVVFSNGIESTVRKP